MAEKKKAETKKKTPAKKQPAKKKPAAKTTKAKADKKTKKKQKEKIKYVGSEKKNLPPERVSGIRQYGYTIGLIVTAVFLWCVAFIRGENVWAFIRGVCYGAFGSGFVMLVFLLLAAGALMSLRKIKYKPSRTVVCLLCLTVLFSGLMDIVLHFSGETVFLEQLKQNALVGWNINRDGYCLSGGAVGALLGGGLMALIGKGPSLAIFLILIFICIVFLMISVTELFGISLSEVFNAYADRLKNARERRKERKAAEAAEEKEDENESQIARVYENEPDTEESPDRKKLPKIDLSLLFKTASAKLKEIFTLNKDEDKYDTEADEYKKEGEFSDYYVYSEGRFRMNREEIPDPEQETHEKVPSTASVFTLSSDAEDAAAGSVGAAYFASSEGSDGVESRSLSDNDAQIIFDARRTAHEKAAQSRVDMKNYTKESAAAKRAMYRKPPVTCLSMPKKEQVTDSSDEINRTAQKLISTLKSFNVNTTLTGMSIGPSVTRYEVSPAPGVKISKITSLADDIALSLAASGVRIEAPIPNKSAVGIEVPNKTRATVALREIISSNEFKNAQSKLNVALGKDITGSIHCADLAKMPHLLIAGTTGSGKSVCLNCMIASILFNASPDEVKMILIDPKQVEFMVYNGIPHLLVPVISNPRKAAGALAWAVGEMENRYKAFSEYSVRDIAGFNKYVNSHPGKDLAPMPKIVIFIDELNDLMMISPKEVEDSVCRLAQKARAAGMHLVVATQRPSVDVITGIIKANIPSRISLSVSSQVDSRTILDAIGAEKLLGNGDMLYNPVGISKPVRIQGAFLSDEEVESIVTFLKDQATAEYDTDIIEEIDRQAAAESKKKSSDRFEDEEEADDDKFIEAVDCILAGKQASTTYLQKRLKIGYARASRLMDLIYEKGYVSEQDGAKPRKILISPQQWEEIKASGRALSGNDRYEQMDYDMLREDEEND